MTEAVLPARNSPPPRAVSRLVLFARDIKLSHTVFAMPWALLATFLAKPGMPRLGQLGLVVLCMVSARTVAMASNRLLDAQLDALNPRTAGRSLPSGRLSAGFFAAAMLICGAGFIGATSLFWFVYSNPLPLILSVPVLLFLAGYPLLKRFTRLCHYYLGAALALAPVCAWIAISGQRGWSLSEMTSPLLMAAAVLLWTAGFDIIYACQDYRSDLETGVISVPARMGIATALWVARLTHLASFVAMVLLGWHSAELATLYHLGVGCAGILLIVEHSLVTPTDLSKAGLAFFTVNGIISLLIGLLGILDVFL